MIDRYSHTTVRFRTFRPRVVDWPVYARTRLGAAITFRLVLAASVRQAVGKGGQG